MKHFHRPFAAALLVLAAVSGSFTAHGQTVGPVPAATIITSAPYTISASGFYQLGANLTYNGNGSANDAIITINAANVTLDFGGHFISGPSANTATTLYGVYANGKGNLTIQNGTVSHCYTGVYLTGSNSTNFNQTIRNLLVTHCYYSGIELDSPSTSQVNDCQVSFISGGGSAYGIFLGGGNAGPGCQINHNAVTSIVSMNFNAYGIDASAVITGNTVDTVSGSDGGYGINGGTLVAGNKIVSCTYGLSYPEKYQTNLTLGCAYPFTGGTDAGGNN